MQQSLLSCPAHPRSLSPELLTPAQSSVFDGVIDGVDRNSNINSPGLKGLFSCPYPSLFIDNQKACGVSLTSVRAWEAAAFLFRDCSGYT